MNILYCAYVREKKFIAAIHGYLPNSLKYEVIHNVDSFDCLKGKTAVIIVGKYINIFRNKDNYFEFLNEVKQREIPIAAIIGELETLPDRNKGLDKVIMRGRGKKSLKTIASELKEFFNIRDGLVWSTKKPPK